MRKIFQPLLTFVRWVICHCELGRQITKSYKSACDRHRRKIACERLRCYGREILGNVARALKQENSGDFVDYGTLLGAIREQDFIKHDDDIDFSLPQGNISPERLLSVMLENGFTFLRAFAWNGYVTELTFLYKKVEVDFFYILNEYDGSRYSLIYDLFSTKDGIHVAQKITRIDRPECVDAKEITVNGLTMPVPVATIDFLEYNYGSDWRIPIKNFTSSRNVHKKILDGNARMFVTLDDFSNYLSTLS